MDAHTFVVADATSIPSIDLVDLLERHHSSGACVTVVVRSETRANGSAPLKVPCGIYVFARRALEAVPAYGFCDIKEKLIPALYAAGERVLAYETAADSPRVLDEATYMAVNEWTVEHLVRSGGETCEDHVKSGDSLVHRSAFVSPDALVVGPVLVGAGAQVLSGAVVVGPTSIGRDATIECGGFVSRSAIWRRSIVGEHATVDRCIVADDAVVLRGAHAFRGVVTNRGSMTSRGDSAPLRALTRPVLESGAWFGRVVSGSSWFRSPATR